jgi:hypothetical protein
MSKKNETIWNITQIAKRADLTNNERQRLGDLLRYNTTKAMATAGSITPPPKNKKESRERILEVIHVGYLELLSSVKTSDLSEEKKELVLSTALENKRQLEELLKEKE